MDIKVINKRLVLWRSAQTILPELEKMLAVSRELGLEALLPHLSKALREIRLADIGVELDLTKNRVLRNGKLTDEARAAGVVDPIEVEDISVPHNSIADAGLSGHIQVPPRRPDGPRQRPGVESNATGLDRAEAIPEDW